MGRRRLRLLCDTNPMCYGSTGALLAILDHLDAEVTAIGRDVTLELLRPDPAVHRIVDVDTKDKDAVARAIRAGDYDAALVVSNQSNVALYAAWGLPFFFVDILYWFGRRKDQPVWVLTEQAFIQDFPGVEQRFGNSRTPGSPQLVGPLIRDVDTLRAFEGTLVHIGGARSRWIHPGRNSPFAAMTAKWLEALRTELPAPLLLACGEDAASAARSAAPHLDARPLAQPDFLHRLAGCERYLTTPGLNAVFEGLVSNRPMVFLPPQNATQVQQLTQYEQAGLVPPGLNLAALDPAFPTNPLPEAELTTAVLGSLNRIAQSPQALDQVLDHLRNQLASPLTGGLNMLTSLPPGGYAVARHLASWWQDRC